MSLLQNISINADEQIFQAGDQYIDFKKARALVMYLVGKKIIGTKNIKSISINPKKGKKLKPNVLEITFSKRKDMVTLRKRGDGKGPIVETLVTLYGFEIKIQGQRLKGGFNKIVKENISLAATPENFINTIKSLFGISEIPEKVLNGLIKTSEFSTPDPFGVRRLKSSSTNAWDKTGKWSKKIFVQPFKKIIEKSHDWGFDTNR